MAPGKRGEGKTMSLKSRDIVVLGITLALGAMGGYRQICSIFAGMGMEMGEISCIYIECRDELKES